MLLRVVKHNIIYLLSLVSLSRLTAQTTHTFHGGNFYFQNQIIWVDPSRGVDISRYGRSALIFEENKSDRVVTFPEGHKILAYDTARFLSIRRDEVTKSADLMEIGLTGKFHRTAGFDKYSDTELPFDFLIPLGKPDWFLGANTSPGFIKGNTGSFFGLFRLRDNGVLSLEDLLDLGVGTGGSFKIDRSEPNQLSVGLAPSVAALAPFLTVPVQTPDHIILVSARAGCLWVLNREDGRVRRTVWLYSVDEKGLGEGSSIEQAILGIHPKPDGKVLIAARDEFAFQHSTAFFKYKRKEQKVEQSESLENRDRALQIKEAERAVESFGNIVWWELAPDTGELVQVFPSGVPNRVQTLQQLKAFTFSLRPKDQVIVNFGKPRTEIPVAPTKGKKSTEVGSGLER